MNPDNPGTKSRRSGRRHRRLTAAEKARMLAGLRLVWRKMFEARRAQYRRTGRFPKAKPFDPWLTEEDKLLPKMPNAELVRVLGRTRGSIMHRRHVLNIPTPPPAVGRPYRPWEIALLGTATARVLAKRLGRSAQSIQTKRYKLGIKPAGVHYWTPAEIALLGSDTDSRVARKLKLTTGAVAQRRYQLGIPPPQCQFWTPSQDNLVGTMRDEVLALKLGRTPKAIQHRRRLLRLPPFQPKHRRWRKDEIRLLGTAPDPEVARRLGRSTMSVHMQRVARRIPGFCRLTPSKKSEKRRIRI